MRRYVPGAIREGRPMTLVDTALLITTVTIVTALLASCIGLWFFC